MVLHRIAVVLPHLVFAQCAEHKRHEWKQAKHTHTPRVVGCAVAMVFGPLSQTVLGVFCFLISSTHVPGAKQRPTPPVPSTQNTRTTTSDVVTSRRRETSVSRGLLGCRVQTSRCRVWGTKRDLDRIRLRLERLPFLRPTRDLRLKKLKPLLMIPDTSQPLGGVQIHYDMHVQVSHVFATRRCPCARPCHGSPSFKVLAETARHQFFYFLRFEGQAIWDWPLGILQTSQRDI